MKHKITECTPLGQFTANVYSERNGHQMIYLSDDQHGDVTLPVTVLQHLLSVVLPSSLAPRVV